MKDISDKLNKYAQNQLLRFENELNSQEKLELFEQINNTDFSYLDELFNKTVEKNQTIEPIGALTVNDIQKQKNEITIFYKKL